MKKAGIFGLLIFLILAFLVQVNVFTNLDLKFTIKLQEIMGNSPAYFLSLFSLLGTAEIATIFILLLILIQKKLNKISILMLYGISVTSELIGKYFIDQKAPPIEFLKTIKFWGAVPSDKFPSTFFSFPSGHSSRTAFVSGIFLIIVWKSKIRHEYKVYLSSLTVVFDALMFFSRVYLGEHWLTDVVGGAILGFSLALLAPYSGFLISRFRKSINL